MSTGVSSPGVNAMSDSMLASSTAYAWQPQPAAWALVLQLVDRACRDNPRIAWLREQLLNKTGTRLIDWIDHFAAAPERLPDEQLRDVGFVYDPSALAW